MSNTSDEVPLLRYLFHGLSCCLDVFHNLPNAEDNLILGSLSNEDGKSNNVRKHLYDRLNEEK